MKAIALYSGGLDSSLAIAWAQRLKIEVLPVFFTSPFNDRQGDQGIEKKRGQTKADFGLELLLLPLGEELLPLIKQPRYGYGRNINPCIDCHILMLQKAKTHLTSWAADFVITGEVLGQRPMSQNRQALDLIARRSGLQELLVRPLSGQLLAATLPEQKGWILREQLLAISGKSRKQQLVLAQTWGLKHFHAPAGGCLLTDQGFSRRLRDLMAADMLTLSNCQWIQCGRYFNLDAACKLVVARNEAECEKLENLQQLGDMLLRPRSNRGPWAIMRGKNCEIHTALAAGIVVYYSKPIGPMEVVVKQIGSGEEKMIRVEPLAEAKLRLHLVI